MCSLLGLRFVNILRVSELEPWQVSTKTAGNPRGFLNQSCVSELATFQTQSARPKVLRKCPLPQQGLGSPIYLRVQKHKNKHLQRHKEKEHGDHCLVAFVFMKYGCEF